MLADMEYALLVIVVVIALLWSYKKLKKKPQPKFQPGDSVLLDRQYIKAFPKIPSYPVNIKSVSNGEARVVFINPNGKEMCEETLPLNTLRKIS